MQDYLDVYKKITTLAKNFEDEESFVCHIPRIRSQQWHQQEDILPGECLKGLWTGGSSLLYG